MKNSGQGSGKARGNLVRVIAAALIVTATSVILGTGPAMAADDGSTPPDAAAGQALAGRILTDHVVTVELLAVLVLPVLVFAYGRRRRSANSGRSAHARTPRQAHARASSATRIAAYSTAGNRTGVPADPGAGDPWMSPPRRQPAVSPRPAAVPPRPAAGQPLHADDYPSWPGRPGPYALHPDHPSWPGRPDPRWAATEAALQADGYPDWPESRSAPWRNAEPDDYGEPGWPGGGGGPAARRQPPPAAYRPPPGYGPPAAYRPAPTGGQPVLSAPVRADLGPQADIMSRLGPVHPESPSGVIDRVRPAAHWVEPQRVRVWDAGAAELATWIISEANQQAADIRHEARDQMAASLADAKHEASELVRKASERATATLTAAEQEAAEIRATVTKLSVELGGVAAQVSHNLAGLATPGTKPLTSPAMPPVAAPAPEPVTGPQARPAARPATKPGTRPGTRPTSRPTGKPGIRPAGKPGTRPAAEPGSRPAPRAKGTPRQLKAIRVAAVVTAVLFLFAVGAGATEIGLHGISFFVFRQTGTGESGPSAPTDQQFLSQEAAAKAAAQKAHKPAHPSANSTPDAKSQSG